MSHDPNCAIVRLGDLRAWCDCRPAWYGGNKIPKSYLDKFKTGPATGLPTELDIFINQLGGRDADK